MKRIQLNLATTEYYEKKAIYPLFAAAVVLVLIFSLINVHRYTHYRSEVKEIETRISQLERTKSVRRQSAGQALPKLSENEMATLREQVGFVNRLIGLDVFPWDRLLDELETCTPSSVLILRFTTTKERDKVRIEGKAESMKDITDFLRSLENSTVFQNSALLNVTTPKEAGQTPTSSSAVRFEIEAAVIEPNQRAHSPQLAAGSASVPK